MMLRALLSLPPIEGIHGCVAVAEPDKDGGASLLKYAARICSFTPIHTTSPLPRLEVELIHKAA